MDIRKRLLEFGKKSITIEELASLLRIDVTDIKKVFSCVENLMGDSIIEPIKASGKNGNITYPLYKKYRILLKNEVNDEDIAKIKRLHPILQKSGYLISHPNVFHENEELIVAINQFFFQKGNDEFVSRKERSFELFGREKVLDDKAVKSMLKSLEIGEANLRFYDTPEYCFHDYIPVRKQQMTLLICENKDIWFNIRRCMFEDNYKSLFGVAIDGVVYGSGNKVSQKQGALVEYVKFMGNPDVKFLYWGDIDREGFDIFRRTKAVNLSLDIDLFLPGYQQMISKACDIELEDSPSSKKDGMSFEDLLIPFTPDERNFLNQVLENNKLIPQEIISYKFLRER